MTTVQAGVYQNERTEPFHSPARSPVGPCPHIGDKFGTPHTKRQGCPAKLFESARYHTRCRCPPDHLPLFTPVGSRRMEPVRCRQHYFQYDADQRRTVSIYILTSSTDALTNGQGSHLLPILNARSDRNRHRKHYEQVSAGFYGPREDSEI